MGRKIYAAALGLVLLLGSPGRAEVEVVFTSSNADETTSVVGDRLLEVLSHAEHSVDIMVAHFNSRRIARTLIRFHRRRNLNIDPTDDVRIRVLLDLGELDAPISRSSELEWAGIPVRYKAYGLGFTFAYAQLLHHKVLIVDGREMVTGSYNWSWTAEHANHEDILHFWGDDPDTQGLIDRFQDEFESLWNEGRSLYPAFLRAVRARRSDPAYRRLVPVQFTTDYFGQPMALTRPEIEALRNPLRRVGFLAGGEADLAHLFFDRETGAYVEAPDPGVPRFVD